MHRESWAVRGGWRYGLAAFAIAIAAVDVAAASGQIRELQRKLWVLGELRDTDLDGKDGPALRESLARFASHRNERIGSDDEAEALLDRAIEEETRDSVGPYDNPLPFDRPSFSGDWVTSLVVAPEDNLVLAGSCAAAARFRLDTGMPAKGFSGTGGHGFDYSSSMDEIVCLAAWDDDTHGLLIVDAKTGLRKDFITLAGMDNFNYSRLDLDKAGTAVWVLSTKGVWTADLVTREARQVVRKLPDNLPDNIGVSDDGSVVAIEFTYGMNSGKPDFPHEIRTYDASTGRQMSAIFGIEDLTLAPQGDRYLATKEDVYQIRDTRTGKSLYSKKFEGASPDYGLAFTSDEAGLLFSDLGDGTTRSIWRWDFSGGGVSTVSQISETGEYVRFDQERGAVYTVGSDGVFRYRLWSGEALTPPRAIDRINLGAAAISPDGQTAVGIEDDTAHVLDVGSGQIRILEIADCVVESYSSLFDDHSPVTFSNNQRLALGCADGFVKELDVQTGQVTPIGKFGEDQADNLRVSPDGFYIAAAYSDYSGKAKYWLIVAERSTGRVVLRKQMSERLSAMGFADEGRRILYGEGHFAVVLDIASGKRVARRELKLETQKTRKGTQWYWGSVRWVLPDSQSGSDALLGVSGTGGLVYAYSNGKFTLRDGKLMASSDSVSGLATAQRVSRVEGENLLSIRGIDRPALARIGAEKWTSQHAPAGGKVLALGSQQGGRFVVVTDVGGILLYDESRSAPVMTTVLSEGGNWLSRIDGGFFAGTRGAGENLFLAPSLHETITVDSLFDTLYRPDLVAGVASGAAPEQNDESSQAIRALLKDGLPPTVAIMSPSGTGTAENENTAVDEESVLAKATITPSTGGVGRIEWRVNGIVRVARNLPPDARIRRGEPIGIEDTLLLEQATTALNSACSTRRTASRPSPPRPA